MSNVLFSIFNFVQFQFYAHSSDPYPHLPLSFLDLPFSILFLFIIQYCDIRDPSEGKIVENFLDKEGLEESKKMRILSIIKGMGKLLFSSYNL